MAVKLIDEDGDPETLDDQVPAAGWEFDLVVGGNATIGENDPITAEDGSAFVELEIDGESTQAELTEILEDDFELIDVECIVAPQGEGDEFELIEIELDGTTATFDVFADELVGCFFVNASTAAPAPTPTPTPTPDGGAVPAAPTQPASSTGGGHPRCRIREPRARGPAARRRRRRTGSARPDSRAPAAVTPAATAHDESRRAATSSLIRNRVSGSGRDREW